MKNKQDNLVQVGRAIECGHCKSEKYAEGLKQAEAAIPGYKCDCVCHDKQPRQDKKLEEAVEHIGNRFGRAIRKLGEEQPRQDDFIEKQVQDFSEKFYPRLSSQTALLMGDPILKGYLDDVLSSIRQIAEKCIEHGRELRTREVGEIADDKIRILANVQDRKDAIKSLEGRATHDPIMAYAFGQVAALSDLIDKLQEK